MNFDVLILGCSSATPMHGRHPSAQIVSVSEQQYLVDCGEGTQMQLSKYGVKQNRIKAIFISHLHGDHFLGLPGLLSSMHLMGRSAPLKIFGPEGLREILDLQFKYSETLIRFEIEYITTAHDEEQLIFEDDFVKVYSFPLNHRIPCTGFKFVELPKLPSLITEEAERLGVPKAQYKLIKRGMDFVDKQGKVHSWQSMTIPAPKPRSYAYCSDTAATGGYLAAIQGVDVLYHEATFMHDMKDRAVETFHTTAFEAGQVAQQAGVQQLIIGHFSARYKETHQLLQEASHAFPHCLLAEEGRWYAI
jgi:ribonuclease Z